MTVSELIEYLRSLPLEVRGYNVWSNDGWGLSDPMDSRDVWVDDDHKRVYI